MEANNNIVFLGCKRSNHFTVKANGEEYPIRALFVVYFNNETMGQCVKTLFCIHDIEKHLGYASHGWSQFKSGETFIGYLRKNYSDAPTILSALNRELRKEKKRTSRKQFNEPFKSVLIDRLKEICVKEVEFIDFKTARELVSDFVKAKNEKNLSKEEDPCENVACIENAVELVQTNAEEQTNIVQNDADALPSCFNFAFDSAKEIVRYGDVINQEIQLTKEIIELKKRISEIQAELEEKEKQSEQNRKLLSDWNKSLRDNPLIKLVTEGNKQEEVKTEPDPSTELKEKLERLENENKALKDRIGEGENFKTAAMFPNKEKYFTTCVDPNGKIGVALSMMAKDKGIHINKVRSGSMEVGNYPVYLHNVLAEWIENKRVNKYTEHLKPFLKSEYRV